MVRDGETGETEVVLGGADAEWVADYAEKIL